MDSILAYTHGIQEVPICPLIRDRPTLSALCLQNKLHEMNDIEISILIRGKSDAFRKKILTNVSVHRSTTILEEESFHEHVLKADSERITSQFYADLRRAWESGDLIVKGRDDGEIYV